MEPQKNGWVRLLAINDVPVDPGDENLSLVVVAEQTTDHLAHLGLWPLSLSEI